MSYQIIPLGRHSSDFSLKDIGRLIAIGPVGLDKSMNVKWLCVCHCGKTVIKTTNKFYKNSHHSCGCINHKKSHGEAIRKNRSIIYTIWKGIISRCYYPKHKRFKDYGGRGITVDPRWRYSFSDFFKDMGDAPLGHTLDRIDNDGPYSPQNCRWSTYKDQANNRRNNTIITFNGKHATLSEWAQITGIGRSTIAYRIKKGWEIEKALQTPVNAALSNNRFLRMKTHIDIH